MDSTAADSLRQPDTGHRALRMRSDRPRAKLGAVAHLEGNLGCLW